MTEHSSQTSSPQKRAYCLDLTSCIDHLTHIVGTPTETDMTDKLVEAAVLYNVTRLQGQDIMPELRQATLSALTERSCEPELRDRIYRLIEGMVIQSSNLCWDQFERIIGHDENLIVSDYRILDNELLYIVVE